VAIDLICRKIGMTQLFLDNGKCVPVTVLDASPNTVVDIKTEERDSYTALQLGAGERKESRFDKAELGHFKKKNVEPTQILLESRITAEEAGEFEIGQKIDCSIFTEGQNVDVHGTSKGRGYSGVVKRHGFKIKKRTHGTHEAFRHGGAIGAGSSPGKVIKGMKMPGQLGNARVTMTNLKIEKIDAEKNLIFVRGGVPGHNDGIVCVRDAFQGK
jgi:large subunit ribosomal protein L3